MKSNSVNSPSGFARSFTVLALVFLGLFSSADATTYYLTNGSATANAAGVTLVDSGTFTIGAAAASSNTSVNVNGTLVLGRIATTATLNSPAATFATSFIVGASATVKSAHATGIFGALCPLPVAGARVTITFPLTASYEFNGAVAQATLGMPATVGDLTISNTLATITASAAVTVSTAFTTNASTTLNMSTFALTVNPAAPVVSYAAAPSFAVGIAIAPITPTSSLGPVTTWSVLGTALPAGLTLNASTGAISGIPTTATSVGTYSILASGPGELDTASISLVVHAAPSVSYTTQDPFVVGTAITPFGPISTGGAITSFSMLGTPLPTGLSLDPVTGLISGTPSVEAASTIYQVLVAGPGGLDTAFISVRVDPVGIIPGAFVFRVSGADRPYTFQLPQGAAETELVTMTISDVRGTALWSNSIRPSRDPKAREITWNGTSSNGCKASAGMYVVRLAVTQNGQTTRYVRKAVTLKPGR